MIILLHLFHHKKDCIVLRTLNKGQIGEVEARMTGWFCTTCNKVVGQKYIFMLDTDIKQKYPNLKWKKES